ncbi:hypothetical protein IT409_00460 [Candidatus Falkowbacteria bacterium]|nr:hypothetical protein [Candidatus Falkowbacteria bacterium]
MKSSILSNLRVTILLMLMAIGTLLCAYFKFFAPLNVLMFVGTTLFASIALGACLARHKSPLLQFIIGLLTFCGAHIVTLTALFHLTTLTPMTYMIVFFSVTMFTIILCQFSNPIHFPNSKFQTPYSFSQKESYLITLASLLLASMIYKAWDVGSINAITSIWHQLPAYFLLLVVTLIGLITWYYASPVATWGLTGFFAFLGIFGNLVYRLGFGFDGFIHRASEQLLQSTGTIFPAPLYYIGHYTFTILVSTLTNISVITLDKILPLVLYALIPLTAYAVYNSKKSAFFTLILLTLPLSLFVNPTPQATSLVLSIIHLILLSLHAKDKSVSLVTIIMLIGTIVAIHPLSGIMLLVPTFFAVIGFGHNKSAQLSLAALASILFPLAFIVASNFSPNAVVIDFNFANLLRLPHPFISNGNFVLDLIYVIGNAIYTAVPFALIGIIYFAFSRRHAHLAPASAALITTTLGWVIMTVGLKFTTLAPSEVFVYTDRVRDIALMLSVFVIYQALVELFESQRHDVFPLKALLTLSFPLLVTSSLYLSFPRFDTYEDSNFKNMTRDDVAVVHAIKERAHASYVTLTHQMTSIAALREFGFDNNVTLSNGRRVFLYPLPTGDVLHNEFTTLLDTQDVAQKIKDIKTLTNVNEIFVALPRSWTNFDAIQQKLSTHAQESFEVGAIVVWLF